MTPAEHLRLPNLDDVKEGIIASKIAAHAADIAKGIPGAMELDNKMACARKKLDWEETFKYSIDQKKQDVIVLKQHLKRRYMFYVW